MQKLVTAAALVVAFANPASARESIKIGLIMPLSGNAASAGQQSKAVVELGAEIQLQGARYAAVWPEKSAAVKLIYPFKGWP